MSLFKVVYSFLIILGFIFFLGIVFFIKWIQLRRSAQKFKRKNLYELWLKIDWVNLYNSILNIIFEEIEWKIKKIDIKKLEYDKVHFENNDLNNSMIIEYKGMDILFTIKTKVKEFKYLNSKGLTNLRHKTYVHERLTVYGKDLKFEEPIILEKNKLFSETDFEAESISFNEKFIIKSKNQLLIAKYFTPKVIDKYAAINSLEPFEYVKLNDKGITSYLYRTLNYTEYFYEILNFRVYQTLDSYINGLVEEMTEDLAKFYFNFKYIEPLL